MSFLATNIQDPDVLPNDAVRDTLSQVNNSGKVAGKRLACQQCRLRKVRCDRHPDGCGACARLGFICSFRGGGVDFSVDPDESFSAHHLTLAGTKRKRTRRACITCKNVKAKCSGTQPCARCEVSGRTCQYSEREQSDSRGMPSNNVTSTSFDTMLLAIGPEQPLENQALEERRSSLAESTVPFTPNPPCIGEVKSFRCILSDKEQIRKHIDSYFERPDASTPQFLHKATFLMQLNQCQVDEGLLNSLCALGLHMAHPAENMRAVAKAWMQEVQTTLMAGIATQSIAQLQTLMLLLRFRYEKGDISAVWMLLPTAARIAFTKRLNYEHPEMDPIQQESLRRLMWSIFILDKLFSGGLEDLVICPTDRMHIRLPSSDHSFERGLRSDAPYLLDSADGNLSSIDAAAYLVRLGVTRERVLRYTKHVMRTGKSPLESQAELRSLDKELQELKDSLPDDLKLDSRQLTFMAHSHDSSRYIILHTKLNLCRGDLHSLMVPGLRESVSQEAFAATPPAFAAQSQEACLNSAIKLCDLWSAVYGLDTRRPINDPVLMIAIYQCTARITCLSHLLPNDGEHSIESLKRKLTHALSLTGLIKSIYPWVHKCGEDVENMIPNIGIRQSRESSDEPEYSFEHSKHSFIRFNLTESPSTTGLSTFKSDGFPPLSQPSKNVRPLTPHDTSFSASDGLEVSRSTDFETQETSSPGIPLMVDDPRPDFHTPWGPFDVDIDGSYSEDFTTLFYIS